MIQLTSDKTYFFCSACKKQMVVRYDDGDVRSIRCPDMHESFLNYKTMAGLRKYTLQLFAPGIGAKER